MNCRSINNKLGEIKLKLYTSKPDYLALCETWITNQRYEPKFHGYSTIWHHREHMNGGGLGIIIKRGIQYRTIPIIPYNGGVLEVQAIEIYLKFNFKVSLLNVYNPNKNITIEEILHYIDQLGQNFLILGDFNAHSRTISNRCTRPNPSGRAIEQLIMNHNLILINPPDFYSHINTHTGQLSSLDLVFSSPQISADINISQLDDIGSDHLPVKVVLNREPEFYESVVRPKLKFTKENLTDFSMNIPETCLIQPHNIETVAEEFINRLNQSASQCIRKSSGKIKIRKSLPWWDTECGDAVNRRKRAYRKLLSHPTQENITEYRTRHREAQRIIRKQKSESFKEFINSINYDTPYSVVWKKFRKLKGHIPHEN